VRVDCLVCRNGILSRFTAFVAVHESSAPVSGNLQQIEVGNELFAPPPPLPPAPVVPAKSRYGSIAYQDEQLDRIQAQVEETKRIASYAHQDLYQQLSRLEAVPCSASVDSTSFRSEAKYKSAGFGNVFVRTSLAPLQVAGAWGLPAVHLNRRESAIRSRRWLVRFRTFSPLAWRASNQTYHKRSPPLASPRPLLHRVHQPLPLRLPLRLDSSDPIAATLLSPTIDIALPWASPASELHRSRSLTTRIPSRRSRGSGSLQMTTRTTTRKRWSWRRREDPPSSWYEATQTMRRRFQALARWRPIARASRWPETWSSWSSSSRRAALGLARPTPPPPWDSSSRPCSPRCRRNCSRPPATRSCGSPQRRSPSCAASAPPTSRNGVCWSARPPSGFVELSPRPEARCRSRRC